MPFNQWCRDKADYVEQYGPTESTATGKPAANKFYLRVINRV